jgi:hypothetical protein
MSGPSPADGRRDKRAPAPRARLTERDLRLLGFIADHRLVLAEHVRTLLDVSETAAETRLRSLTRSGYLRHRRLFHHQPGCYQITRQGLAAIGSGSRSPRLDLACYQHDVGVAWLWLAARSGAFGPVREVISERRLRSHDASPERTGEPLGVRLGGYGPGGRPRLHYPDLLLVMAGGQRAAVELELTAKGRARREGILWGYAVDSWVDAVLYLIERPAIGRSIQSSARALGIADRVHVQPFRWSAGTARTPTPARASERTAAPAGPTARAATPARASKRAHVDREIAR